LKENILIRSLWSNYKTQGTDSALAAPQRAKFTEQFTTLVESELRLIDETVYPTNFQEAFDTNILKEITSIAIKKLSKNISNSNSRGLQLLPPNKLMELVIAYSKRSKQSTGALNLELLEEIIDLYIATGIPVYSTGYMGRQFSGVIPLAGLTDLLTAMMSQPSSFYESAQLPSMVEKVIAKEFGVFIGWKEGTYDMVTTSGGSLANITAILTARNCKIPDFSNHINPSKLIPAIAVSADVHYSVKRAAGILGIGDQQIISLPTNSKGQICMLQAEKILKSSENDGFHVFCLVATAGTTAIGAIDPLEDLADLCQRKKYWFHVDGAHGGSFLVSEKLKERLKGIQFVDSFALDAHKTMFLPAACTLLFYKNKETPKQTFHKDASYIFENESSDFDGGEKSFECTKRPMIMNLWIPWVVYGKEVFAQKLEALCALTLQAYQKLETSTHFETLHVPQTNILCFRYVFNNKDSYKGVDFQMAIRDKIKEGGKFFISKVEVQGITALRVVFMNHEINMNHFEDLLAEIKKVGQNLMTNNN
jgi:L-2,4-diaminobutyrate decarboxylase